jgi:hypothetical protein
MAFSALGQVIERVAAMTRKGITLEFIIPTVVAVVLSIILSIGGVYLTNCYLGPVDQSEIHVAGSAE